MSNSFYHTISDSQWKIIEPHLPKAKNTGKPNLDSRTFFNSIFWILESGAKWRYIQNWNSIYHKFRQCCDEGMDLYQHAAGARKILGNQNIGTSRGGKPPKFTIARLR